MTLRLAIIGLGKIARDQHLPAIAATEGIELSAIASPHSRLDGVACFASLDDLLERGPALDAVALCTPPQGRQALAARALAAGLHVLLEKPPGATVAELRPLPRQASETGRTLFASWHTRFAPVVPAARAFLSEHPPKAVTITWKEDVRVWHPGQDWIFEPGGLGVFDPGINALSLITALLPDPLFVTEADLFVPENRQAPIAANLKLSNAAGLPIRAEFDFRQSGEQSWDMRFETEAGPCLISGGGTRMSQAGGIVVDEPEREYPALYRRFLDLVAKGESEIDDAPLVLVADAFLIGRRFGVEAFES